MRRRTHFVEGRHYEVDVVTGCWNWLMQKDRKGYGLCGRAKNDNRDGRAHRESWRLVNGPIPDGRVIDHLCRNKSCINPEHLDCVRQAENVWRGEQAKITPEIAEEMRRRIKAGDSLAQLARDYGVSGHVPFLIAEDRCWRVDPDAPRQPIRCERTCPACGEPIVGLRHKRYCDERCRHQHYADVARSNRAGNRREQRDA